MKTHFTTDELRRAARALQVIQEKGNPSELRDRLALVQPQHNLEPSEPPVAAMFLAGDLARLLDAPQAACDRAAAEALAPTYHRRVWLTLLEYARELTSHRQDGPLLPADEVGANMLEMYRLYGLDAMIDFGPMPARAEETPQPRTAARRSSPLAVEIVKG